ncbi:hypothetical protein CWATWH0003_1366 [Crocosphaera watsonii WH 0003]|uniref:Uncharacterized protein n=1 Tax=Crocosphaera watsonii WH 0003 TaxID=423471 RepID=G5J1I2_CROWT|nr:hypothetical protein CWATWH0003_1366 [Crocosphaera watsonii WH 0003]
MCSGELSNPLPFYPFALYPLNFTLIDARQRGSIFWGKMGFRLV